jgi:hypothetical protein
MSEVKVRFEANVAEIKALLAKIERQIKPRARQ